LEDLDAEVEINSAWETIRENIKISAKESLGYFELKKHKPWFDEGCSKLLDQSKHAKLQWLQDPSEINGDNLNNGRREASRHFRNKKREYLKDRINELATNSKNKNFRDLSRHQNVGQNPDIRITTDRLKMFHSSNILGTTVTIQNLTQEEIKRRLNSSKACYHSVQNLQSAL
jgi:hypothetical protein